MNCFNKCHKIWKFIVYGFTQTPSKNEGLMANKREKPEDFIGWKSPDGKLEVIGITDEKGKCGRTLFKVTCTECSKDPELFPDGYFVSRKCHLINSVKPCGCSNKTKWKGWQFLILARRAGEKSGFVVHGFAEEFKNQRTKLNIECLKDGHKWTASINNIMNGSGCSKCSNKYRPTEQEALQKCIKICKENNYDVIGFVGGYKGALKTYFEYICKIHGRQNVQYHNFVNSGSRCGGCARDSSGFYGYYPERKDETDFLYVLNFDNKFIKVGRSFNVDGRIKKLRSESTIKKIYKLRIFTAIHQEIYDFEQELHNELRDRNFQHYVGWSNECFESESLLILNKLLDKCDLEEVHLHDKPN